MTDSPVSPPHAPADPLWPRASDWLSGEHRGERADLAFVGVPAFRASLSSTGAFATPRAVRAVLARFSTYSTQLGLDLADTVTAFDHGDVTEPDDPNDPDAGEARTRAAVAAASAASRLTVVCGGDNSITVGSMLGAVGEALPTAGLVTLDAHHDLRDGRSNGSPVRRLVEAGLDPRRIVQVGIAEWANSAAYARRARELGITVVPLTRVRGHGVRDSVRRALEVAGAAGGPVYVDLDLDVCDRSVVPGCPASQPGGLSAAGLLEAAFDVAADPRVVALDLTEVDATADTPDQRTVRLAAMCVLQAAAGLSTR